MKDLIINQKTLSEQVKDHIKKQIEIHLSYLNPTKQPCDKLKDNNKTNSKTMRNMDHK